MVRRISIRALLLAVALLAGCESRVVLGSECVGFAATCRDPKRNRPERDASDDGGESQLDGGALDASSSDAASDALVPEAGISEAGPDATPPPLPPPFGLDNPSFEITKGSPGGVGGLSSTEIGMWSACGGTVEVFDKATISDGVFGMSSTLLPSEGATFLRLSLGAGPAGIRQDLPTPLKAGQRYAFAVDLVRTGSAVTTVKLGVRRGLSSMQCAVDPSLVESESIPSSTTWRTECIVFTPTEDVTQLVLTLNPSINGTVSLYVDNMRLESSCM